MLADSVECFVPWREIETHERRLPHWQQGRVATFVTWRLADALPAELLSRWQIERDEWLARHPRPWTNAIQQCYTEQFGHAIDRWLDAGRGDCLLRDPATRSEVVCVMQNFDGERYHLHAWVVMPNHVHVLFSPMSRDSAGRIIGAWKGVSARRIHQLPESGPPRAPLAAGRSANGSLWQSEYWDTLIRSPRHFAACRQYIAENPAQANLAVSEYSLWLGAPEC